jgi:rhodanese-related sulfurtransferase
MNLISRDELKSKIEREDDFKLVFVLGEWQFRAKHIPGSLHIDTPEKGFAVLDRDDDIVVYCSIPKCAASQYAYKLLGPTVSNISGVMRVESRIGKRPATRLKGRWLAKNNPVQI